MESLSFIQWCLDNLNYWTITFLMMIESSFIPFPSEIVIIPAAYKAAYGELNMYLVVIFGTLGADLGAIINYYLARWISSRRRWRRRKAPGLRSAGWRTPVRRSPTQWR